KLRALRVRHDRLRFAGHAIPNGLHQADAVLDAHRFDGGESGGIVHLVAPTVLPSHTECVPILSRAAPNKYGETPNNASYGDPMRNGSHRPSRTSNHSSSTATPTRLGPLVAPAYGASWPAMA